MRSTVLERWLLKRPFVPFRIVMTDGLRLEVRHPDQAAPSYAEVLVTTNSPDPYPTVGDYTISVSYLHIMRIEPILPAALAVQKDSGDFVDNTAKESAKRTASRLAASSTVITGLVKDSKVKVVSAIYDLKTGVVTYL